MVLKLILEFSTQLNSKLYFYLYLWLSQCTDHLEAYSILHFSVKLYYIAFDA